MKPINILNKLNESSDVNNHKINTIKYTTNGYTEATDGEYKGEPIVNYREKDFKKGTSVLMPFICNYCGKEFYVKSNIHDFFKQGDFDDPYETPEDLYCPKCKEFDGLYYNGEPWIKEPGVKENINESEDDSNTKVYLCMDCNREFEIDNDEWPYGDHNCPYCLSGDVACDEEDLNESNNLPTWCGVPGTIYRYHGDWSDPEVEYEGKLYSEWDLQEYIGEIFNDYCEENNIEIKNDWAEKFSDWLSKNPDYAYSAFSELRPNDEGSDQDETN